MKQKHAIEQAQSKLTPEVVDDNVESSATELALNEDPTNSTGNDMESSEDENIESHFLELSGNTSISNKKARNLLITILVLKPTLKTLYAIKKMMTRMS